MPRFLLTTRSFLVALVFFAVAAAPASASMLGTEQLLMAEQVAQDRAALIAEFSRDEVAERLTAQGIDPSWAAERVARMTDAEIQELQARMDELPAGASALGAVAAVFLIMVLLDAFGVTDIFSFVQPVR
ncbi:hypothetical protein SAMN05216526_0666 [Ectothiorhodosinus mongolicus]|uniref:PA2779 family protein n=1 Tax=Ectothiorhodosinus mongolicus TaxID=233100 RepID=A0A1R3VPQ6_9GAMM|nr:DUF6627 family protein [Ectothiorhodosinus mongolicus]ULX56656.1 hypothetical protein CKX93_02390 [Ectothiorhodosinus mongolicus]SIT66684.1 hypothetical protein SAMN05216526_0666 [Ectothiorhodosinus mongolicus]